MSSRYSIGLSLLLPILTCGIAEDLAWGHAYPVFSTPGDGEIVRESPGEVRIQFTEGIEVEFSRIEVKNAKGEPVGQGKFRRPAGDSLAIDLKPLGPGAYTIEWQVLSVDTHVTEGTLRFSVPARGK